jgi:hypothetical protein
VAPDGDVDDGAAGTHRRDGGAEHGVDTRALERHVRTRAAGQVADGVRHVDLGRVEHLVGAGTGSLGLADGGRLDDLVSKGFKELIDNKEENVKILVTPKDLV